MTEWKMEITCPKGHNKKIVMYFDASEFRFQCIECDDKFWWWEPTEENLAKYGVTLC